jgi:hypothetical protein
MTNFLTATASAAKSRPSRVEGARGRKQKSENKPMQRLDGTGLFSRQADPDPCVMLHTSIPHQLP